MRKPCPGERNLPLKRFYTLREKSEGPPPVPAKTKHCIATESLHADQPPFTPPVSASVQFIAATRANAVAFESFVFKCMIFIFYHIENLRICIDVYNTWRKTPLAVADDDLG